MIEDEIYVGFGETNVFDDLILTFDFPVIIMLNK